MQERLSELQAVNEKLDAEKELDEPVPQPPPRGAAQKVKTSIPLKRLKELNQSLLEFPEDFHLNPKLKKSVERRRKLLEKASSEIDWATAEELAFASILQDGVPIRLTGEDSARGTFSQRHAVFYDAKTGGPHIPLQAFPQANASFEILNSPLSRPGQSALRSVTTCKPPTGWCCGKRSTVTLSTTPRPYSTSSSWQGAPNGD